MTHSAPNPWWVEFDLREGVIAAMDVGISDLQAEKDRKSDKLAALINALDSATLSLTIVEDFVNNGDSDKVFDDNINLLLTTIEFGVGPYLVSNKSVQDKIKELDTALMNVYWVNVEFKKLEKRCKKILQKKK